MKNILIIVISFAVLLNTQTLFEVKDSSDNTVFSVSDDGVRVINGIDTMLVISSTEAKINLDNSQNKALSRSFSVSTTTTAKEGFANVLEVSTDSTKIGTRTTTMGSQGDGIYTDFTPDNIFLGLNAGFENQVNGEEGINNVFLGNNAGYGNTSGFQNTAVGANAGMSCQTDFGNVCVGAFAGEERVSGGNTILGMQAGRYGTDGSSNTFVGYTSGRSANGDFNTFVGMSSGVIGGVGNENVYLGHTAGYNTPDGSGNVYVGKSAGKSSGSGSDNVYLGKSAGLNATGSGNIFIGKDAGFSETLSNRLYIHNSNTETPLIYGEFWNQLVRINGDLDVTGASTVNGSQTVNGTFSSGSATVTGTLSTTGNTSVGGYLSITGNIGIGKIPGYTLDISDDFLGLYANINTTSGTNTYGVYASATGGTSTNYGIYGYASGTGTNYAGYFSGDINVTGTVVKSADLIKVDHPFDPENKILTHSTISSDKMMNIYSGNVVLDTEGNASVILADWVESYNNEFRYQLTGIGGAAPNLHIANEISNGEFKIGGGKPGMKVSWEITGIRNDNYAQQNPIEIEKFKNSEDRGYYINPEAYGLSREKGIDYKHEEEMKIKSEINNK